ncbi:Hypothetical protein TPAR_09719 [Tolypocladium paradoxum]|uniref:Berberine/berberine-like domain-containing protein n=1 Tax=Tolypocladium paradoxum TaxID=94208 RepID=A0A2S4KX71_9HYPO|nr:Hypothetical protein TPAR_09719 [Tolypocladium paradoxum]
MQGVKAVPMRRALPRRRPARLAAHRLCARGPALDGKAVELGEGLRQMLHEAGGRSELNAYVNYAYGGDTKRDWYGHEQWRQERRLLALKNKYDPQRRFSFYGPIA